ncbi:MAG: hypothetical protein JWQ14_625, partial [Adhaeribacter sp.]|nr:hypothetical protein [Adhaeribacter sp.]
MKKIFLFSLVVSLMAFSCEKEESYLASNTCKVNNPTAELAWLKAEINRREQNPTYVAKYFYIQQAEYKQQTVFIYNNCCPVCGTTTP